MPQVNFIGTPYSTWGNFGAGLAKGFEKSFENQENLSIAQKMTAMKNQQENQQRMYFAKQAESEGMPAVAKLIQLGMPMQQITALAKEYPHIMGETLHPGQGGQDGQGELQEIMGGLGQRRPMMQGQNLQQEEQMTPIQDQEAVEEPQEMPQVQRTNLKKPNTQPQTEFPKFDQLEGQLHNSSIWKNAGVTEKRRLDSQLKSRYDALVKGKQLETSEEELGLRKEKDIREAEKHEKEMETEPRKYIEDVEKRYSAWNKQKINMQFMAKNAYKVTDSASLKKMLMNKFDISPGLLLNEPEQAMDKFASANMQGVSQAYPGQIKVVEFENFVKSHPSLLNSPTFIQNMSNVGLKVGEITQEEFKESQKLRREYRNRKERLPEDFHSQIEEKLQPKFDSLGEEIDKIMNQKLPSSFKKWQPKDKFSGKKIQVTKPDGTIGMIPEELKDEFVKKGYKL